MTGDLNRRLVAEFLGTAALVFLAVGTAVVGGDETGVGSLGIALAFGVVLVFAVYAFGPVSGPATPTLIWALATPANANIAVAATPDMRTFFIQSLP